MCQDLGLCLLASQMEWLKRFTSCTGTKALSHICNYFFWCSLVTETTGFSIRLSLRPNAATWWFGASQITFLSLSFLTHIIGIIIVSTSYCGFRFKQDNNSCPAALTWKDVHKRSIGSSIAATAICGPWSQTVGAQILAVPLLSCVTLNKYLNLSVLQCPQSAKWL